jgi:hypothetical protein
VDIVAVSRQGNRQGKPCKQFACEMLILVSANSSTEVSVQAGKRSNKTKRGRVRDGAMRNGGSYQILITH